MFNVRQTKMYFQTRSRVSACNALLFFVRKSAHLPTMNRSDYSKPPLGISTRCVKTAHCGKGVLIKYSFLLL